MSKFIDLTGQRFGRWTVIELASRAGGKPTWLCQCDCGSKKVVQGTSLPSGASRSCGCLTRDATRERCTTHGHTRAGKTTQAYRAWAGMLQRCGNPKNSDYPNYGGRGIQVCERWQTFENFYADMGDPPPGTTVDRIDSNGNYEPGNVRWADSVTQSRNRRHVESITFNGETLFAREWAEKLGLNYKTLSYRLRKNWPLERALTAP